MPDEDRLRIYLDTLYEAQPAYLESLESEALSGGVPIIRKDTQRTLRTLLAMKKPEKILEIGTAVGFSSVFFCTYSEARVVTIENDRGRIPTARRNFKTAGFAERIRLLEGNAEEVLPGLTDSFDLVFLDAAKGQYLYYLPELLRLLEPGGLLLSDNVFIGGDLLESSYFVERRFRTIHRRMREYLREIIRREGLVTTVLPVGDGLAVTVKQ